MSRWLTLAGSTLAVIAVLVGRDVLAAERPPFCGIQAWQPIIREAAHRFELPRAWLDAVMLAESAGCTTIDGKPNVSAAGAIGLMQLMPATWREYRARLGLGDDPYYARDNIFAGAAYLHELYQRYGEDGFLAAYQAGPGRYEEFIRDGRPLPRATIEYVARVQRAIGRIEAKSSPVPLPAAPAASPLFVVLTSRSANADGTTYPELGVRLFVPLSPVRRSARVSHK
jgi:soluble lytic murein transglycosylase-like protein